MSLKAAELFAGYGGLALAVEEVFGAETTWFSEFDTAPSKILAHHWPDVPNYGDVTQIDFNTVPHVDIISGGSPCQDLSAAGRRAGMTDGTRSNLWVQMREAIATIQPRYVVWENVRGAYSAEAYSELEHCTGCMGNPADRGTVLRALGRVLGDLSDLGYDCQWRGLRAADVGAPHGRFRVFILATHRDHLRHERTREARRRGPGPADDNLTAANTDSGKRHRGKREQVRSQEQRASTTRGGSGHNDCLNWGEYEPAIRRWESIVGRPAPAPAEPSGRNGNHRLSARFCEWMMGVPEGWIVDVPGITRDDGIKAAGNGVVPQQAAAALRDMLPVVAVAPEPPITYTGAHGRVWRARGKATDHTCQCGKQAHEWAYVHDDPCPHELVSPLGQKYSMDIHRYKPMCRRCHRLYDKEGITHCPQGHEYAGENLLWDAGKRKCRTCVYERNRSRARAHEMTPQQKERKLQLQRERRARAKAATKGPQS